MAHGMKRKPAKPVVVAEPPPKRHTDRYDDDPVVGMSEILFEAAHQLQPLRIDQVIASAQATRPDLSPAVQWLVNILVENFPPQGNPGRLTEKQVRRILAKKGI